MAAEMTTEYLLLPEVGWSSNPSESVLAMLWSVLHQEKWHFYNFTSDSSVWECRVDPGNRVSVEFKGDTVERLTVALSDTESEWSRFLEDLMDKLTDVLDLVRKPVTPEL